MKRETTPARISDKIMELCGQVVPGIEPVYVPTATQPWCLPNECFPNVERMVKEQGGRQVNGWTVWQWANMTITTEAHAIWQNPEGKLIDITPHDCEEKRILFLRDSTLVYLNKKIKGKRMALTDSPLVAELIQLTEEMEAIICEYKPGVGATMEELQRRCAPLSDRYRQIVGTIYQEVKGNEFCPCQSGLKYKKCCGRDEYSVLP